MEEIHELLIPYGGGTCIVEISESELLGCPIPEEDGDLNFSNENLKIKTEVKNEKHEK